MKFWKVVKKAPKGKVQNLHVAYKEVTTTLVPLPRSQFPFKMLAKHLQLVTSIDVSFEMIYRQHKNRVIIITGCF